MKNESVYRKKLMQASETINFLSCLEEDLTREIKAPKINSFRSEVDRLKGLIKTCFECIDRHKKNNDEMCEYCLIFTAKVCFDVMSFEVEKLADFAESAMNIAKK